MLKIEGKNSQNPRRTRVSKFAILEVLAVARGFVQLACRYLGRSSCPVQTSEMKIFKMASNRTPFSTQLPEKPASVVQTASPQRTTGSFLFFSNCSRTKVRKSGSWQLLETNTLSETMFLFVARTFCSLLQPHRCCWLLFFLPNLFCFSTTNAFKRKHNT